MSASDTLTSEELELMSKLPAHVTADERASILADLRHPDPNMRRAVQLLIGMSPEQLRQVVAMIDREYIDREYVDAR